MARHSRGSTLTQPTDVHDDGLQKEREALALPFSKSPFIDGEKAATEATEELAVGELRAKVPNELPWSDLLLEIAMTTAFASLTDGTPILLPSNALSYLCYFLLVWWIWASQTAYNLRYRQADWLHRVWVFLQLLVFSSLAAFTRDFDITNGISADNNEATTDQLLLDLQNTQSDLNAKKFRDNRLPRLNARGLSMAMALSRMLLLLQYVIVLYHARYVRRGPIWTHIISLVLSTACYFAAFIALQGKGNVSETVAIVKIGLWYFPVLVEVASHFVANMLPGHVRYSTKGIIDRSGTVFIIILGGGLDKITTGFQDIVGNTGLGKDGSGLFLSAAVIFLVTYLLYFGSTGSSKKLGNQRTMTWFFAHILYLSAVIITLQGVATSLSFANLDHAIEIQRKSTSGVRKFLTDHPGVNLTAQDLPDAQKTLPKLGLSVDSYLEAINFGVVWAAEDNNSVIASNNFLQLEVVLLDYLLTKFKAEPDVGSFLWAKIYVFGSALPNSTDINGDKFADIYSGVIESRGSSALWFYGAAGSTLLGLVILTLIQGLPRDKWEWGSAISRFIVGVGVTSLSLLSLGSSKPAIDSNLHHSRSKIWVLNFANWVLPVMALVLALLQFVEYVLVYLAYRAYFRPVIHQTPEGQFQPYLLSTPIQSPNMSSAYGIHMEKQGQPPTFDPYNDTRNSK